MSAAAPDAELARPWTSAASRRRLAEIQDATALGSDAELVAAEAAAGSVRDATAGGLMLYAGSNLLPGALAAAHDPLVGVRGSTGDPGETAKPGIPALHGVDVLEVLAARAVAATVGAPHADVRPPSATLANLAVYAATTRPGATIAALPAWAGGHFSHHARGAAGIRGHDVAELPWDGERQDVDLAALPAFLDAHRPELVLLGGSVQLFANDVAAIAEQVHARGARLLFDAAHPAGLICGGAFPNPLDAGADVLTFSTYKSYGGPPGGVVATRDAALAQAVATAIFPGLTANWDAGRMRPLLLAARLLLRDGARYGERCVAAARVLALALAGDGFSVMAAARGHTETNQVLVRMPDRAAAEAAVQRCAAAGVYLSATEHRDEHGTSGALRLGTQELVRRGLGPEHMVDVAGALGPLLRATASTGEAVRTIRAVQAFMQDTTQERSA